MGLPWRHFSPASRTSHLEESIITGTRLMSGSDAMSRRKAAIASSESSIPSSMFTSMICAPPRHLLARDFERLLVVPLPNQPGEARRARHVGALAHVHETRIGPDVHRLEAAEAAPGRNFRNPARGEALHRLPNRSNVGGRGAAAAAHQVQKAAPREFAEHLRHEFGRVVVFAELVGKTRVGVHAHRRVRHAGELPDVGAEIARAQGAVQPDAHGPVARDGVPERLGRLAGEGAAARVRDGSRTMTGTRSPRDSKSSSSANSAALQLSVSKAVSTSSASAPAREKPAGGFGVGRRQLLEGDVPEARLAHPGRDGGGAIRRAQNARDEAGPPLLPLEGVGRLPGEARRRLAQLPGEALHPVIRERYGGRVERIGFDDVRARLEKIRVDAA